MFTEILRVKMRWLHGQVQTASQRLNELTYDWKDERREAQRMFMVASQALAIHAHVLQQIVQRDTENTEREIKRCYVAAANSDAAQLFTAAMGGYEVYVGFGPEDTLVDLDLTHATNVVARSRRLLKEVGFKGEIRIENLLPHPQTVLLPPASEPSLMPSQYLFDMFDGKGISGSNFNEQVEVPLPVGQSARCCWPGEREHACGTLSKACKGPRHNSQLTGQVWSYQDGRPIVTL